MVEPALGPGSELALGANEFRVARGHWPKDYPELSRFLKDSDPDTCRKLQAVQFSHVEFGEAPNGWLRVSAAYPVPPSTHTASAFGATFSGGTVSINDMTIAPNDPQGIKDNAGPKPEKTN